MKNQHEITVFGMNESLREYVLTEHIRNSNKDDYMKLISDVNDVLIIEIMKIWKEKEINEPIGTISPEIINMINDKVDNSIESYYKTDLDQMNDMFESSVNELNNISEFLSTTHRPELLEMLESDNVIGYLSGGYKLINMDL